MLNHVRLAPLIAILGAGFLAVAVPKLNASFGSHSDRSFVTFSGPVQIGHDVLAPGTYVFRVFGAGRSVVEVLNANETRAIGFFDTIPVSAPAMPRANEVVLTKATAGNPAFVHEWFRPGQRVGWEFPILKKRVNKS